MKNTTAKKMKKLCWVLLLLITVCLFAVGCGQSVETTLEQTTQAPDTTAGAALEGGFGLGGCEEPIFRVAFTSDRTEFDINDVTLTFFYGGSYYPDIELAQTADNVPSFDIYFANSEGEKFFVKHVEENLVSEKYRLEYLYDEQWNFLEMKYNHSESLTIPKEIFTQKTERIFFSIYGVNLKSPQPQYELITGTSFYYKIIDERVILSDIEFK